MTRTEPLIDFPAELDMIRWAEAHAARLEATYNRPELHGAWQLSCLGMKAEGNRLRKGALAREIAFNDARMLGTAWPVDPFMQRDIDAAAERARRVGSLPVAVAW